MAKPFDHYNHKRLWNWLANNPGRWHSHWPEWEWNGGCVLDTKIDANCFACASVLHILGYDEDGFEDTYVDCDECPFDWQDETLCSHFDSNWEISTQHMSNHYGEFGARDTPYAADAVMYARRIRDLPVRKGVVLKEVNDE